MSIHWWSLENWFFLNPFSAYCFYHIVYDLKISHTILNMCHIRHNGRLAVKSNRPAVGQNKYEFHPNLYAEWYWMASSSFSTVISSSLATLFMKPEGSWIYNHFVSFKIYVLEKYLSEMSFMGPNDVAWNNLPFVTPRSAQFPRVRTSKRLPLGS